MKIICSDMEGDDLLERITKCWCFSATELDEKMKVVRSWTVTSYEEMIELISDKENIFIMHNGVGYDKPAMEKVLGVPFLAEVVDTLFLSWYLYPKLIRHGLGPWGEELGFPKPPVDDWTTQPLEVYIHRCEEDVKIQTALWRQMWKHLTLLYETDEEKWKAVRHINFKARQAALQEKTKWKLDVPECERLTEMFGEKYDEAKEALEMLMPRVPIMKKKGRPKKPFLGSGELSKIGQAWASFVKANIPAAARMSAKEAVAYDKEIKYQDGDKHPNAGSSIQLKKWLFDIGWVPQTFKFDRNKDTGEVRQIPQVKNADTGELCPSIEKMIKDVPALEYLREMGIVKHRKSVTKGFLKAVSETGYVVAGVQGFTNTLRFKHRTCLNLPSLRKAYGKEIRGLLLARSERVELCGSDMSSLEDRTKQHFMWPYDPEYVTEMLSDDFDPHCDMAVAAGMMSKKEQAFYVNFDKENCTDAEYAEFTRLANIRHGGKSCNYAATYGAGGATIARAAGVPDSVGDKLHAAYWSRNWSLTAIADACIVKQSRGMKWLWNPVAKMWIYLKAEKDRFSTLNQSTGTYCFDRWLYYILERREQLTGQFHDEGVWELPKGNQEAMTKILKDSIADVNEELKLNRKLDCDVDYGMSYAEIH